MINRCKKFVSRLFRTWVHKAFWILLLLAVVGLTTIYSAEWSHKIWDRDPNRGAAVIKNDPIDKDLDKVVYLSQNWNPSDSLWFYSTTQGSDLIPYDFFLALEQAGKPEPFRSPENMNRYRYLPQRATSSNPDGLPVGMVADTYQGKKYMGFSCAACHTSQINYNGTGIRIDGGQTAADMDSFMKDLGAALTATGNDPAKKKRFSEVVLKLGNYRNETEVLDDLKTFTLRTSIYNYINETDTAYGYGRLDAFGRIFNRVLQHVLTEQELREVLSSALSKDELDDVLPNFGKVLSEKQRDHIVERLVEILKAREQAAQQKQDGQAQSRLQSELANLRGQLFNPPNAPVSYPFLWDTPQHDYVQWNGVAANVGEGPIGRNSGEVIGVFATLDWSQEPGWTLSSVIGGQWPDKTHFSFKSSVDLHNLRLLEAQLSTLQSPQWPENILPAIDKNRANRGAAIFDLRCATCHAEIDRADPKRHVIANFSKLSAAGTDPKMALNAIGRTGYSGILTNQYVNIGVGNLYLKDRRPVAALLIQADTNVVATPDPDKWFFQRWADWAHDLAVAFFSNDIKQASLKSGNFDADTNASPLTSLLSYKARSLNGIWATAPYLHNGSVPTLYDLLLPARKQAGDRPGMEYRPAKFSTGSREFDPVHVGFRSQGYNGFVVDTGIYGNGNSGHEYGTRDMKRADGTIEKALTREERLDLVEYLKTL
ncbi:MAG TPA: di-heme-cytochrome C peroxidase [Gallionellaceae bacterium]